MVFSTIPQARNLGLLLLLLLACLYTALASVFAWTSVEGQYNAITLTGSHYLGFIAIAGCFVSYVWLRSYFRYALVITLLLSLFNLAVFLPSVFSMGLSFGEAHIGVNPVALLLLIIYYLLNRSAANTFIRKYLLPAPTTEAIANQRRDRIEQFKQTFRGKSDESLRQILLDNKLVPDAIAAAHKLLKERGTLPH